VEGEPGSTPRVAYAIGRRVGGAVHRNRLRRQLRAIASELGSDLQPGAYLIAAAPAAAGLSYGELRTIVSEGVKAVAKDGGA
jgi:ribonuclease P protein component